MAEDIRWNYSLSSRVLTKLLRSDKKEQQIELIFSLLSIGATNTSIITNH